MESRIWTEQQDQILKSVVSNKNNIKWGAVSKILEDQFKIHGHSAKQCQQRWQNDLDFTNNLQQWSLQEQQKLFHFHNLLGNKWAKISQYICGRSDNSIKNHFYSTLRKAFRGINRYISERKKRSEIKPFKNIVMGKIISLAQDGLEKNFENRSHSQEKINQELYARCIQLKNRLLIYGGKLQKQIYQIQETQNLIKDIATINKSYKCKKIKRKPRGGVHINQIKLEESLPISCTIIQKKNQKNSFKRCQLQQQGPQLKIQVKEEEKNLKQQYKPILQQTMPTAGIFPNPSDLYYFMQNGNNIMSYDQLIYFFPWMHNNQYLNVVKEENPESRTNNLMVRLKVENDM